MYIHMCIPLTGWSKQPATYVGDAAAAGRCTLFYVGRVNLSLSLYIYIHKYTYVYTHTHTPPPARGGGV